MSRAPRVCAAGLRALLIGTVSAVCFGAPAAFGADFTWSGGGGASATKWSNGANWLGDVPPTAGASIGTLTFPKLASGTVSEDDLSGVSVGSLNVDDSHGTNISGNGLTLGAGGLTLNASELPPFKTFLLRTPLTLSATQTWNISAPNPKPLSSGIPNIELAANLTGESADLTINLNSLTWLFFESFLHEGHFDDELLSLIHI